MSLALKTEHQRLSGQVALITGAGRGLGQSVAIEVPVESRVKEYQHLSFQREFGLKAGICLRKILFLVKRDVLNINLSQKRSAWRLSYQPRSGLLSFGKGFAKLCQKMCLFVFIWFF